MNLMDNRTSNLMKVIKQNTAQIKEITFSFSNTLKAFQQSMNTISMLLINLVNNGSILRENLNQLQSSIQTLVEDRISPFLIHKLILTQALQKIQRKLTKSYPGFYLTHFEPS